MILYQGKTYENSTQKVLLESLKKDCFNTLDHQQKLEASTVINACDQLTKKIQDTEFDHIIKPLLETYDIPESHVAYYLNMFSKDALEKKVTLELGNQEVQSIDQAHQRHTYPLGILFHIAAGNIDVLPAYSVIEGLLAGNINILKLPTGDQGVSVTLLSELIKIEPLLKDYIYVFDVPSTEVDTLKQFADIADAIVVWGGDTAVNAARNMATPNTKIIEWGHKLSFAYASLDAPDNALRQLATNIASTNQLLCSSAQGIYVDTDDRQALDKFAERFFKMMCSVQEDYQPVPLSMRSKNAVELYYQSMVTKKTGKTIWQKDGISVITSNDTHLETSLLFRNVWVKMLPIDHLVSTLKQSKNYLQTASILAPKEKHAPYQEKLIKAGVVRIKKPHEMSQTITGESHDGMYPLRLYSRIVETVK